VTSRKDRTRADRRSRAPSLGNRQRLGLACASGPPLGAADPGRTTNGLDPMGVHELIAPRNSWWWSSERWPPPPRLCSWRCWPARFRGSHHPPRRLACRRHEPRRGEADQRSRYRCHHHLVEPRPTSLNTQVTHRNLTSSTSRFASVTPTGPGSRRSAELLLRGLCADGGTRPLHAGIG